jgi:hypothetical protein
VPMIVMSSSVATCVTPVFTGSIGLVYFAVSINGAGEECMFVYSCTYDEQHPT